MWTYLVSDNTSTTTHTGTSFHDKGKSKGKGKGKSKGKATKGKKSWTFGNASPKVKAKTHYGHPKGKEHQMDPKAHARSRRSCQDFTCMHA
jgi:hypothetical protein